MVREFQPHGKNTPTRALRTSSNLLVTGGMDGAVSLFNVDGTKYCSVKKHSKFIVSLDMKDTDMVVSAGYDGVISLFSITYQDSTTGHNGNEHENGSGSSDGASALFFLRHIKSIDLPTIPTCARFCIWQETPVVAVTRQDSAYLYYYSVDPKTPLQIIKEVRLSDAQYVSDPFTPLQITFNKKNGLMAVATNHVPYMRVLIVHVDSSQVVHNLTSLCPQDHYSSPQIQWSHDNTLIWCGGDDGLIRGLDIVGGRIVEELKCHTDRIRDLIVGDIDGVPNLISGGADKKVIRWW